MKHLALILICASVAWGQFPPGSSAAKRISAEGDSLPATCDTRDLFLRTGATAPGVYGCTAPNTWTGPANVTGGDGDVVGTTSASNPAGACTAGKAIHVNTATSRMFVCGPANNQWIAVDTGVATSLSAPYVDWNAGSGGASILNKPSLGTAAAATLGTGAGQVPVTGDYQPSDSDLTAIAALECTENQIIKRNGSGAWICAADATGGGGTIEIQNNAGTKEGDFSIVRLTNGAGTTWSITNAATGRARSWSGRPREAFTYPLVLRAAFRGDASFTGSETTYCEMRAGARCYVDGVLQPTAGLDMSALTHVRLEYRTFTGRLVSAGAVMALD